MNFNISDLSQVSEESQQVKILDTMSSRTFFTSALDESTIIMNKYRDASNTLYASLAEGSAIGQAIDQFADAFDDIVDMFGLSIQKSSDDFISELTRRTSQDQFILDKKYILCNYPEYKRFIMERYKFINLDANIPKNIAKFNYEKEYGEIEKILTNKYTSNQEKIIMLISEYEDFLRNISNGFYDRYRGEIIGKENYPIRKSQFAEELFYCFRKRNKIKSVDSDDVKESYQRLSMFKKYVNLVRAQKRMVEKEYNSMKKNMESIRFDQLVTTFGPDSQQLEAKFDTYIKVKIDQIVNMCNIHMLAYNAKLDAIASCYLQDRSLLLSAMTRLENDDELGGEY